MDTKTFAKFLLISACILVAWWVASYIVYGPASARRRAQPQVAPAREAAVRPATQVQEAAPIAPSEPEDVAIAAAPDLPEEPPVEPVTDIILDNGLIRTYWTNQGAALQKLELLDERYRAPYKEDAERPILILLADFQEGYFSDTIQTVTFVTRSRDGSSTQISDVDTGLLLYDVVEQSLDRLVFERVVGDRYGRRLRIRKTVTIQPQRHNFDVTLEFQNTSQQPYEFTCALRGAAGIERETARTRYLGTRVGIRQGPDDYKVARLSPAKLQKGRRVNELPNIAWAGVVNHYFVAITRPENTEWVGTVVSDLVTDTDIQQARGRWPRGTLRKESDRHRMARQNATVIIQTVQERLEPGGQLTERYSFIAAPKEAKVLARYGPGLTALVELGILPSISRLALAVLGGVYSVIPNYGVAILVLTVLVRVILHPLTRKSQLSMTKMQKLNPHIAELQKKYAKDRQKLAQEQLALFRRYGVSPLSGCWPMFLQMPVFIALFGALRAAIELRHAGFLWVGDLSRPDTLFHLPADLPLLGGIGFNLLPILMGAVMLANQRFTPEPAGEQARQQQKMMKWFPLVFVVMLYGMPSGLCLYWTASTAIGLLERWLIDKKASKMELKPVGTKPVKDKQRRRETDKPEKPTWFDKLQKMLESQPKTSRAKSQKKKGKRD